LTLLIINKTDAPLSGEIGLTAFTPSGPAQVYRYSPANLQAIVPQANQPVSATGFSATFPATSLTLLVIPSTASALDIPLYLPLVIK
jgi:hypothetical protein